MPRRHSASARRQQSISVLNGRPAVSPGHTCACVRPGVKYTGCVVLAVYRQLPPTSHYTSRLTSSLLCHSASVNERMWGVLFSPHEERFKAIWKPLSAESLFKIKQVLSDWWVHKILKSAYLQLCMFLTYETQSVLDSRFPKYDLFSTVNAAIGFNEIHSLLLFVEVKST